MAIGPITSKLLDEMVKHDASDMYVTVGCKPSLRIGNKIIAISDQLLKTSQVETCLKEILNEDKRSEFEGALELNTSLVREDGSRYRFNFFRQQENTGFIIRRINIKVPTIEELGLPEIYAKSIMRKKGLIILASPGGSGKTTSMAAMIGHRNRTGIGHILTIEDPIEFVHKHGSCIITQREMGVDTYSYGMALKNALRQRADVIAIGEIRDKETLEYALRFAETGHLCIATMHSNNSYQALTRMANLYPDEARQYVLSTIAQNLTVILAQRIVTNIKGKNIVVCEVLLNEGLIKNLISDNRLLEIKEAIERAKDSGMQTFDQALYKLYESGEVSAEVAISEADNAATLKLKIAQSRPNLKETNISYNKIDYDNNTF